MSMSLHEYFKRLGIEVTRSNEERSHTRIPPSDSVVELVGKMFEMDLTNRRHFSMFYSDLKTKIKCLHKSHEEYFQICKYISNTHGPTHRFKVKVRNIFSAWRGKNEYLNYKENKKLGNRMLLWHGTKIGNYPSILKNGLKLETPSNVSTNGKMFGNGVYFADVVTKAAQYAGVNARLPDGVLILAEVILGKHYERTRSEKIYNLPLGKNSVKGLGKYKPAPSETVRTKYKVKIPLGSIKYDYTVDTVLDYNEYIVYDNNQILIQYLVHVDFEYLD